MTKDIFTIQHELSECLTEKRFYHSLGVQTTSFAMAIRYHYNIEKANLAGLVHDCAKCLPDEQLLLECENNNLPISEVERRNPFLLHSKLGAFYAEYKYGIKDTDILSAITYHTTGKPEMNLLEKIVFTADFIEPSRSAKRIPTLNEIRDLAFHDLDRAVYRILDSTLNYLGGEAKEIDNLTAKAYEYYKIYENERGI